MRRLQLMSLVCAPVLLVGGLLAQTPSPVLPDQSSDPAPSPKGQIIIQSHGDPPSATSHPDQDTPAASPETRSPGQDARADVSDDEREALTVTSYDLDARLNLERSGLNMRARVEVRNDGKAPLRQLALQISSSLRWESATLLSAAERKPLVLAQHRLDTDADHTGAASEAVLPLPEPLAPGKTATLDLFYSGTAAPSGDRLARLGANAAQQRETDWDGVTAAWTGLRGFGNVLWYPVASPQLFLAEGNTLFTAVGRMRLREEAASVRLRLNVEYTGEPPVAAYFCGRRTPLKAVADDPSEPTATGAGIATADFAAGPLGFRLPSLFVIQQPEILLGGVSPAASSASSQIASSSSSTGAEQTAATPEPAAGAAQGGSSSNPTASTDVAAGATTAGPDGPVLALVSADPGTAAGLGKAADRCAALLAEWLGPQPLSALTLIDHGGQPYQDGPLLVAPAATLQTSPEGPALVYSLTHGWVQTGQPWMDEGLAQFFALLWVERESSRDAAVAQLTELIQPVSLAEPELTSAADTKPGQPIVTAPDELFYRRKSAAVWWMLRDIAGDKALRSALTAWRTQPELHDSPEAQAVAFEHLLERLSGQDLGWFFNDWVLRDRGLPDLSIVDVATSQTPAKPGHNTGWLVAVTVHNEGAAIADVPLVIHSGQYITASRIRVPGFGQATQRVLVEAEPTEVTVNDGSTPEARSARHSREISTKPK